MDRELYFSFFMFTVDLRPEDLEYRETIIGHVRELTAMGYRGFDLPIAPTDLTDRAGELESYAELRGALDAAGLADVRLTTNVAATRRFDPTSVYREQRDAALAYLRSRVDITAALGGEIMAGPIIFPYNVFPLTDRDEEIWSDALRAWLTPAYERARPVLSQLAEYAESRGVRLAIEPVDHWEQPAPNSVEEVLGFLEGLASAQLGVCIDSAHVMLAGGGPAGFATAVRDAADAGRIHYVHISAPDRGALHDSWIPWKEFLEPIVTNYSGPFLLETFNAIPPFLKPLQMTRAKFWIPGEDDPVDNVTDAYTIAREGIAAVRKELEKCA